MRITETVVAEIAAQGRVVLVGRAAPAVLARERDALHVKLVAPRAFRIQVAAARLGCNADKAADRARRDRQDARPVQPRVLPPRLERPGELSHGAEHRRARLRRGDGRSSWRGRRRDGVVDGANRPTIPRLPVRPHPNEIPPFPYPGSRRSGFTRV